jgi:hypothetical protein
MILEEKLSKTIIKNFFHVRLLNFMALGYISKNSQNHRKPLEKWS